MRCAGRLGDRAGQTGRVTRLALNLILALQNGAGFRGRSLRPIASSSLHECTSNPLIGGTVGP